MKAAQITGLVLTCFFMSVSWSQGNTEEVIIITQGNRAIEPAFRKKENPKIIDTVFPVPNANYPLLSMDYNPYITLNPIVPATVKLEPKLPQLYKFYAKVGMGSVFMPLAEIYFNNTRTRKMNYGVNFQHLSSLGEQRNVAPANFDRNSSRAYIGMNERKFSWNAETGYTNNGFHYYGFNNENANADSIKNRFGIFGLKGDFTYHRHDSLGVNWKAGFEYRNFASMKPDVDSLESWRVKENYFQANGGAWLRWGDQIFNADVILKTNKYKYGLENIYLSPIDSGLVSSNTIFSIRPNVTTYSKNKRLKARLGVDITASKIDKTQLNLYPDAEVKYSLFDDILIPYAQLKGGMRMNNYYSLSKENEFIRSQVNYKNENTSLLGMIGLKGTLSKRVGFNVQASFANIKDKALFVTDTTYSAGNKFKVIYDTMNVAQIEGSLTYQLQEKTKIDLIGRYNSYSPINNSYAWNLPQFEGILKGTYNMYDRIIVTANVHLQGGRKALVYAMEEDVVEENGQLVKTLGFVADADLGVEFRYNTRISGFVNFNNVAAQRYRRWYNYPVQGFQAMVGVTVRF
jgi:hypothetical protein